MRLLDKLECWGPPSRHCFFLPMLASLAAPYIADAVGGDSGGGSGSAPQGQQAPAPSQLQKQDTSVATDTNVNVITTVNGTPININIGGTQTPDGSLSGGRYFDRGVDEPSLYAPFGTLQDIEQGQTVQWGGWLKPGDPRSIEPDLGITSSPRSLILIGGGVLIVLAVGAAIIKRGKRVR